MPVQANFIYKIPKDSSYVTMRNQNRMVYANYRIQQNNTQSGCQGVMRLENGGVAAADLIPKLLMGARETTAEELQIDISSAACPVTVSIPIVIPPDYNTDVLTFARRLNTLYGGGTVTPTSGGALTIGGNAVGNYDYTSRSGNTTISSFLDSDWFTSTEDTVSTWIIINGNLTINTGQTLIPTKRKLFTVMYVKGDLTVNGTISMSARGANHSGTGNSGGYTAPVDILLATGTYSSVTNPKIPATGGAGGGRRSTSGTNAGTSGTDGGTGGGESGNYFNLSVGQAGAGAAGTCFSGGSGGGSTYNQAGAPSPLVYVQGADGGSNGGAGGQGGFLSGGDPGYNSNTLGGTGNPGGDGWGGNTKNASFNGGTGTGGVLIVICEGALSGTGSIVANAPNPTTTIGYYGGGSGGGSVNVFYKTNPSGATVSATKGASYNGGNGTARKLVLP